MKKFFVTVTALLALGSTAFCGGSGYASEPEINWTPINVNSFKLDFKVFKTDTNPGSSYDTPVKGPFFWPGDEGRGLNLSFKFDEYRNDPKPCFRIDNTTGRRSGAVTTFQMAGAASNLVMAFSKTANLSNVYEAKSARFQYEQLKIPNRQEFIFICNNSISHVDTESRSGEVGWEH